MIHLKSITFLILPSNTVMVFNHAYDAVKPEL